MPQMEPFSLSQSISLDAQDKTFIGPKLFVQSSSWGTLEQNRRRMILVENESREKPVRLKRTTIAKSQL